jgi:hypothetical protein
MKSKISLLMIGLVMLSCATWYVDETKAIQEGKDTGLIRKAAYVSNTASELVFDTDASLMWGYTDAYDNIYLLQEAFTFAGNGTYTITDFKVVQAPAGGRSSTVVIVDQSGSYEADDGKNTRSKSLDKFFYDVQAPSDFMLGASASAGAISPEPIEFYQSSFSNDAEGQVPYLFGLAKRTGGKSAILDALSLAIDKVQSSTGTRNVVALVHGPDQVSSIPADALITKALSKQVKISIIMLGVKDDVMTKIGESTGGLVSLCPTEKETITTFNHLYRLLNYVNQVYRLRVKFVPTAGGLLSGTETVHTLMVHDKTNDYDYNPMVVYVKIP